MDDEVGPAPSGETARTDDGTGAVLYGMFTSFTEALSHLEERLAAIEAAVRAGPPEAELRLAGLEESIGELSHLLHAQAEAGTAAPGRTAQEPRTDGAEVSDLLRRQLELLDQRTAALATALDAMRALLQAHVDDTANSLGRRAGEAGRRLASDLGLRGRPKPPSLGP